MDMESNADPSLKTYNQLHPNLTCPDICQCVQDLYPDPRSRYGGYCSARRGGVAWVEPWRLLVPVQ
jgi:hypothetical protein